MKPSIILTILGLSLTAIAAPTPGNRTQSFPFKLIRIFHNQTKSTKTLKLVMLMPTMPILLQPLQPLPHLLVVPLFQLPTPLQTHLENARAITLQSYLLPQLPRLLQLLPLLDFEKVRRWYGWKVVLAEGDIAGTWCLVFDVSCYWVYTNCRRSLSYILV